MKNQFKKNWSHILLFILCLFLCGLHSEQSATLKTRGEGDDDFVEKKTINQKNVNVLLVHTHIKKKTRVGKRERKHWLGSGEKEKGKKKRKEKKKKDNF